LGILLEGLSDYLDVGDDCLGHVDEAGCEFALVSVEDGGDGLPALFLALVLLLPVILVSFLECAEWVHAVGTVSC
jgi:hypothetical protein